MNISGASGSSSSTTDYTRITGLASGLDVDGLVKQALSADQTKIDKVKQDSQYVQWQQEAYVGYIKDLKDFASSFDILQTDNMMTSSTYTGTSVSSVMASTGVAGDNYLTASTYPGAVKGNYQVKINSLAQTAKSQSYFNTLNSTSSNPTDWSGQQLSFTVGADPTVRTITLGNFTGANVMDDVIADLNNKISANPSLAGQISAGKDSTGKLNISSTSNSDITYVGNAGGDLISTSNKTLKTYTGDTKLSDLGINSGSFTISISGQDFNVTVDSTKTISQFESDMQNIKSGNTPITQYFNINFSDLTKKLTIETKNTGSTNNFTIKADTTGNATAILGINGSYTGQDASVSIKAPGEANFTQVTKGSNSFTLDNVTYNLQNATAGDTVNLNVKADASSAVDKFKKFIDKYNALIDKINTSITQKKNYDYKPLTDAQKSSMTADQITAWETKAKEGILRRDDTLSNLVSSMRQAVYDAVSGAGISITDIGITTTSNYMDGGKLKIDETKLKAAIEQKGDLVKNLFTKSGTTNSDKGIFQRFKDVLNNVAGTDGTLIKKAGYINTRWVSQNDLSKSIAQKTQKIKDMQETMKAKQQHLYNMYSTLESNLNKLNSQSSWLTSQMSG
ncbi:hypothetical protein CSC2_15070 [Clostridium zeae]|uniref:Flagellar hook-associated protein 2 n=1 Tax=Clostridium zeae TaxID=2759022 RepID=A0ABQ1E8H8_9CLOT|nr:flagellar filament capping protein FliD [Clostridium zeae]GFZ30981.1 hypothetical protein CSC2_15070 [Clostridium zeae]